MKHKPKKKKLKEKSKPKTVNDYIKDHEEGMDKAFKDALEGID